jgi:putative membrane protein
VGLVLGMAALYTYAIKVIGPRAVQPGEQVVSRRQVAWFAAGVIVLWVSSDWPMHDIAEGYLYSVHMVQHLLLSLVLPPLVYFGTPTWLARMIVGRGTGYRVLRQLARPVPAALLFNAMVVFTHWPVVVNGSVENGLLHYGVHVVVVAASFLMWLPVAGPFPEMRISLPAQCIYLFVQSVIPTVPAGWLTFAEEAVYRAYDTPFRMWGLSVAHDQQIAALFMKVGAGLYLWVIIAGLFFRWAAISQENDRTTGKTLDRRAPVTAGAPSPGTSSHAGDEHPLTWAEVARELERAGPPPKHPTED